MFPLESRTQGPARNFIIRESFDIFQYQNRKTKRRAKYRVLQQFLPNAPLPDSLVTKALDTEIWQTEVQTILQAALMKIKPKWRTVLVLKDIEGLSYNEIARIANCNAGTVCSRLNRGRKALRAVLAESGIDKNYFRD